MSAGVDCPLGELLALVRPAVAALEMAKLLQNLPLLAAAFRDGRLSEVQAREIAEVAAEVPDAEVARRHWPHINR